MNSLKKIKHNLRRLRLGVGAKQNMRRQYSVAGFKLYFPDDHQLEQYQSIWHLYDRALGLIAKSVLQKYPHTTAIDIGANVGDSAALIQAFQPVPTLCIEGNPEYFEYLEANAQIIGNIEIADCFIGPDQVPVALDAIASHGGTSSIVDAIGAEGMFTSELQSLASVLQHFPQFQNSKLLKIDTDGFDFTIIQQSREFIEQVQPIIHFEYEILSGRDRAEQGLQTIDLLMQLGYQQFAIYDNFGNYLISLSSQHYQQFEDLTHYLISNHYKSGRPAVYYFDICAFAASDLDLFEQIRAEYRNYSPPH